MFHLVVNRLTSTKLFGATIFNPGVRFPYGSYKVAVYAWSGGFGSLQPVKPFKRLGFFRSKLPSYSTAEAYLITNSFVPPPVIPAPMAVDGANVFAYDWQTNGFKWFDFSTTNNPALF